MKSLKKWKDEKTARKILEISNGKGKS